MKTFLCMLFGLFCSGVTGYAQSPLVMEAYARQPLSVEWRDVKGKLVRMDGLTVWSMSTPNVVSLKAPPAANNCDTTCDAFWENEGLVTITATADSKMGPGVQLRTATIVIDAKASEACCGTIIPGTPEIVELRGIHTIVATLEDDQGVVSGQLLLDSMPLIAPVPMPPMTIEFSWDTRTTTAGPHKVEVVGVDAAGNEGRAHKNVLVGAQ